MEGGVEVPASGCWAFDQAHQEELPCHGKRFLRILGRVPELLKCANVDETLCPSDVKSGC